MATEKCKHANFEGSIDVNRLVEKEGHADVVAFMADVRIRCADCQERFRFIGLPAGADSKGACVSVDGLEGRFAILPKSESLSFLDNAPAGFTVRKVR